MDAQYNNDSLFPPNHQQSLTPLSYLQSQQFTPNSRPNPHTLPPLQNQRSALAYANGVFGQASRPPQTSFSPTADTFSQQPQSYGRYQTANPAYPPSLQQYSVTPTYMANSNHYTSNQAPDSTHSRLPEILPMPYAVSNHISTPVTQGLSHNLGTSTSAMGQIGAPSSTHVVGSQGRRGILPSAEGRPAAVTTTGTPTTKSSTMPAKDVDGKFPCPHCNKTYLHAKHLKRHLLRHTGDRPYMCILCKDTFSRSDILKRHFQKCSIRRGNPTGATHLSYSHSHLKKQQQQQNAKKAAGSEPNSSGLSPPSTMMSNADTTFENNTPPGLGLSGYSDTYHSTSTPVSRSNSIKRLSGGITTREKRSMTGSGLSSFSGINHAFPPEHISPSSLSTTVASMPLEMKREKDTLQFAMSHGVNSDHVGSQPISHASGESILSRTNQYSHMVESPSVQGNPFEWSGTFQSGTRDIFMDTRFPTNNDHLVVKAEPQESKSTFSPTTNQHEGMLSGLFDAPSSSATDGSEYHTWDVDHGPADGYTSKANQLIDFCLPAGAYVAGGSSMDIEALKHYLTPNNVRHFLSLFSNFQAHWPVIHMPSFNPMETYHGLLLAMICIGAVYSDRMNLPQVRALMGQVKYAVDRSSHVSQSLQASADAPITVSLEDQNTLEQLQALTLLQNLSIWHGDPQQRQSARNEFGKFVTLSRKLRLLQPLSTENASYSILHQPAPMFDQVSSDQFCSTHWNWATWVQQEKRSRLMYILFLLDAALVVYFNSQPCYDPMEIQLPLPADDEAWEAKSAHECASALGLNGPRAQSINCTGSLHRKQPEMHQALGALLHPTYEFQLRSTNAYSKFVLVHGLHVQIWNVQRQLSQGNTLYGFSDFGGSTPMLHTDWIHRVDGSGRTSTTNSGQATPTDSSGTQSPGTHQLLKSTTHALQKWKQVWDEDMPLQYPSSAASARRVGFCRDGIHFFWLARLFLRNARAADWQAPPDARFVHVMNSLKKVRSWVASENTLKGEEIGSVGDIDESYGVADLTLDMKLLFTPIHHNRRPSITGL